MMATTTPRRRTARRPVRSNSAKRRQDALLFGAVAVLVLIVAAVRWVNEHRALSGMVLAALLVVGGWWLARRIHGRLRARRASWLAPIDLRAYLQASPGEFEQQTAALCRRDGARDAHVVGGAGDLAADVLATTPDGRRILIQCKRYKPGNPVKSEHVQMVNGTYRDIHHCQQAIIVTTSGYTRDAVNLAQRVGIRLVDANGLAAWARGGPAPWS
jgi:restriction system protein